MNENITTNVAGKIYTKGAASESYTCDQVTFEIKFYCSGVTGSKATENVLNQCERFLECLSNAGVDIQQIQLEKDQIRQSSYREDEKITGSRTLKFSAEAKAEINNYILKIIHEEHLDAELSTTYSLSNENDLRKQLRMRAIADSRETADMLAEAAGKRIVGVDTIDVNGHTIHQKEKKRIAVSGGVDELFCIFSRELSMPTKDLNEEVEVTWLIE